LWISELKFPIIFSCLYKEETFYHKSIASFCRRSSYAAKDDISHKQKSTKTQSQSSQVDGSGKQSPEERKSASPSKRTLSAKGSNVRTGSSRVTKITDNSFTATVNSKNSNTGTTSYTHSKNDNLSSASKGTTKPRSRVHIPKLQAAPKMKPTMTK